MLQRLTRCKGVGEYPDHRSKKRVNSENAFKSTIAALVVWSMVMRIWIYELRLSAVSWAWTRLNPQDPVGVKIALLPQRVRWKAGTWLHSM